MNYKGYTAIVEIDEEDGVLHGRVADIRDVITFESESIEGWSGSSGRLSTCT